MQWASTNDTRLERRMRYVVRAMDGVRRRLGPNGYLSAFPEEFLDRCASSVGATCHAL